MAALAAAAAAASVSSWIPEDDILLKNAVEAGASLEALAKGAVRFSRRFTVRELQERWHSLLYDPVVSVEASARMAEFELSASVKSVRSGIGMHSAEVAPKRKFESVRRLYHALRKKICSQPLNSPNATLLGSANGSHGSGDRTACQENHESPIVNSVIGDCVQNCFDFQEMDVGLLRHGAQDNNLVRESVEHEILFPKNAPDDPAHILGEAFVDFGSCPGVDGMVPSNALPESNTSFHSLGYASPQSRTPLWKTIEDIPAPAMPISLSHEDKGQCSEETFVLLDDLDEKKISLSAVSESYLADLSDSLLNLGNEEELHPTVADEKDTPNKSCCDGNNPLLASSPDHAHEDHVVDVKEHETTPVIPNGSSHAQLEVIVDQSLSSNGDKHGICCSEVNVPSSTLTRNCQSHDLPDREMECVLNSEDPEIPCNDDFVPGKVVASSAQQAHYKEASKLGSSFATQKNNEQMLSKTRKEDNSALYFSAFGMGGIDLFPGSDHNHPHFSCGVKCKSLDVNCPADVSRQANNSHLDPSQYRSILVPEKSVAQGGLEQEPFHACNVADQPLHAKSSSTSNTFAEPEANPSTLDQEALIDKEQSESDEDIPYFSVIESMILDMDLCPDDSDRCINKEVSKYQHEDSKRTIVRLEQCARSAMQRAIAYQGALAVFYGRHLKHYMKATEIILGRATDDIDVDVDLGREGPANKISRRQALIKMGQDGSFSLKNLGKSSIFLNGKEIVTGQSATLSSSSLIEIREMAFMFEINHKSVREYLANVTKRNQEKNIKYQWSEGVP